MFVYEYILYIQICGNLAHESTNVLQHLKVSISNSTMWTSELQAKHLTSHPPRCSFCRQRHDYLITCSSLFFSIAILQFVSTATRVCRKQRELVVRHVWGLESWSFAWCSRFLRLLWFSSHKPKTCMMIKDSKLSIGVNVSACCLEVPWWTLPGVHVQYTLSCPKSDWIHSSSRGTLNVERFGKRAAGSALALSTYPDSIIMLSPHCVFFLLTYTVCIILGCLRCHMHIVPKSWH